MGREILGLHGFPSEFKPLKGGEKVYLPGSDITKKKKTSKSNLNTPIEGVETQTTT